MTGPTTTSAEIGLPTTDAMLAARRTAAQVRAAAAADGAEGAMMQLPWSEFIHAMRLLPPQSYGARIQNWLRLQLGWDRVGPAEDRGDARTPDGAYVEIKVTLPTPPTLTANFVQIRPHQRLDGYALFVVEPDDTIERLWVPTAAMHDELDTLGASAHGTLDAVHDNATREYAIRFPWHDGDATARRWRTTYRVPLGLTGL